MGGRRGEGDAVHCLGFEINMLDGRANAALTPLLLKEKLQLHHNNNNNMQYFYNGLYL